MAQAAPQPLSGLLRRNTFAVLCSVLTLVLLGVDFYLWRESLSLERRTVERTAEGEANLSLIASGPLLRQQHALAEGTVKRIDASLLVADNLADNLGLFYKEEEASGARVSELHQLTTGAVEEGALYRAIPFSLEATGTFEQVAGLLHRLETGPHQLRVSAFSFERASADGGQVKLSLSLDILGQP